MLEKLRSADVVFVGENHDDKSGHEIEKQILDGLFNQNHALALSLEMFERDTQPVLDEYLSGYITESSFLAAARPWPNYKSDYRPLIEFCRENHLPVIAANAPHRYVSMVTRKGQAALQTLPAASRAFFAPLPIDMRLPPGYERQLDEIFHMAHGDPPPSGNPTALAMPDPVNMKQSQALWDATMCDSILRYHRKHGRTHILQINGAMHSDSGYGIVDRLQKAAPALRIVTISLKSDTDFPRLTPGRYDGVADFIVLTRPAEKSPSAPEK